MATALADGIPSACATLAGELKDLKSQLASLQADLQQAVGGSQKAPIAAAIKNVNAQIAAKQQALDACIAQNQPPPTPSPTYSFDTGTGAGTMISIGGGPADSNIAVSATHICLTARGAFACYTKGGTLVSPGPGYSARPYNAKEFFEQAGVSTIVAVNNNDPVKDGRVVFDATRRRLIMVFQTREATARLLIAVSKSEDPRDGWWTYADSVGTQTDPLQDYHWLGVNSAYLLVANIQGGQPQHTHYYMYPTANLAAGQPYTRLDPPIDNASHVVPCVHNTTTTDAFWVRRDDDTHVSVWAVRNGLVTSRQVTIQASTGTVNGPQPGMSGSHGGNRVDYSNIGRDPQNAEYRDGRITFVSNDGHTWSGQPSPNNAVRLVRFNVSKFFDAVPSVSVDIDRIFGRSSAGDPAGAVFDYGWPAVASNTSGDIVVGSVRSNATTYPQLRGSVWFAGKPDISSSVLLRASLSPPVLSCPSDVNKSCLSEFHMAGASADPSSAGVYLSQQFGTSTTQWLIHVTKMLGTLQPDLIATQVQSPTKISPAASYNVMVTVTNQGDKPMPASQGDLYLSSDNVIDPTIPAKNIKGDPLYATFSVPALVPNQVITINVAIIIPAVQKPGQYYLGVALDTMNVAAESSESNNLNPFLAGDHGNAPITIE